MDMIKKDLQRELVESLKELDNHPLSIDLLDYIEGKASNSQVIKEHLETCEKCRQGIQNLKDFPPPDIPIDSPRMKQIISLIPGKPVRKLPQPPDRVSSGQVWITRNHLCMPDGKEYSFDIPLTIVITKGEEHPYDERDEYKDIRVAPISEFTIMASPKDLLLSKDEPPLYTKAMMEVWNEVPTLKGVLGSYLGVLSRKTQKNLKQMLKAELTREELPISVLRGFPILTDDDPRLEFQSLEQRSTHVLGALSFQIIDFWEEEQKRDKKPEPGEGIPTHKNLEDVFMISINYIENAINNAVRGGINSPTDIRAALALLDFQLRMAGLWEKYEDKWNELKEANENGTITRSTDEMAEIKNIKRLPIKNIYHGKLKVIQGGKKI